MEALVGYAILGALSYWAFKATLHQWPLSLRTRLVHGPDEHEYRPVLRWTDKTERYLETVHMCECGSVQEDEEPPDLMASGT